MSKSNPKLTALKALQRALKERMRNCPRRDEKWEERRKVMREARNKALLGAVNKLTAAQLREVVMDTYAHQPDREHSLRLQQVVSEAEQDAERKWYEANPPKYVTIQCLIDEAWDMEIALLSESITEQAFQSFVERVSAIVKEK